MGWNLQKLGKIDVDVREVECLAAAGWLMPGQLSRSKGAAKKQIDYTSNPALPPPGPDNRAIRRASLSPLDQISPFFFVLFIFFIFNRSRSQINLHASFIHHPPRASIPTMDFLKKAADSLNAQGQQQNTQSQASHASSSEGQQNDIGGFLGSLGNKLNSAAGGGKESEKDEDYLDKGMSYRADR
jgi:hypothetical protein